MGAGAVRDKIIVVTQEKDLPKLEKKGKGNTRYDYYKNGKLIKSRWTDEDGIPLLDKHYTDHGHPKQHPIVPHYQKWGWINGSWEFGKDQKGEDE